MPSESDRPQRRCSEILLHVILFFEGVGERFEHAIRSSELRDVGASSSNGQWFMIL